MPNLAWIDVETTGLSPVNDIILEVGCIITDINLNEVSADSWLVGVERKWALQRADPAVVEMHTKSGLLEALQHENLPKPWDVADAVAEFMSAYEANGSPMCGSSVHFDRAMIASNMPTLLNSFSHRNIDVSTVKGLVTSWGGDEWTQPGEKLHRALPDLRASIAELQHYRRNYFIAPLRSHDTTKPKETLIG